MKNEDTGATELYFEGPISAETWLGDEITPGLFKSELEQHPGDLTVWICSPGGDVFAASQIYTMLRNHKGKITVKIDALAASAASVVAMSGDETFISPTGMLMVHDPACFASGNKADMEKAINGDPSCMHLDYTKDVMDMMTEFRKSWKFTYPEEE